MEQALTSAAHMLKLGGGARGEEREKERGRKGTWLSRDASRERGQRWGSRKPTCPRLPPLSHRLPAQGPHPAFLRPLMEPTGPGPPSQSLGGASVSRPRTGASSASHKQLAGSKLGPAKRLTASLSAWLWCQSHSWDFMQRVLFYVPATHP